MAKVNKKFKTLISIFDEPAIGGHYSFLLHLKSKGITSDEFISFAKVYFKKRADALKKANKFFEKMKIKVPCPECGKELGLLTVNIPQGKSNLNGWRSLLECTNCTYQSYSKLKIEQRRTKINRARRII